MKINVYNNKKNIFFEFERNKYELDETNNIITPNTSWFFLKPSKMDSKMNRYKLTQGDIIRIGRITMRIRDIKFEDNKKDYKFKNKNNNNTSLNDSNDSNLNAKDIEAMKTEGINNTYDNIKLNKKNKNKSLINKIEASEKIIDITQKKEIKNHYDIFSKIEKKNNICRICYIEEEDDKMNPLVQPCICDGSLKYVHLGCLRQWINTQSCVKLDSNDKCSIFLVKPVECELCKTKFPDYIKHQNKLYPLLDFSKEYKNYLVLESLTLDKNKNKFIYMVSLEKNKIMNIGRGHNCEIILSDISISRIHSKLILENKNIFIEDNDSKFGTLILVQAKRLKISQDLPLFIQIGRTSFEIKIKKTFRLFDCCDIEEKNSIYYYYNQNEKYIKDDTNLIIKNNESEDENIDYKNNNTQDIYENKKFINNSINIKERDKMSDNEYFLIKHNKRNKDIKKNIFFVEDIEKEDNRNTSDNNKEDNNSENNGDNEEGKSIENEGNEEKEDNIQNDIIDENENNITNENQNSNEDNNTNNENNINNDNNENLIESINIEEENGSINITSQSRNTNNINNDSTL